MGWYRPVHRKSVSSQEVLALLAARKQMQIKAMDLEQTLRGLLRGFGLKVGDVSRGRLAARIRQLVSGHVMLERIGGCKPKPSKFLISGFFNDLA